MLSAPFIVTNVGQREQRPPSDAYASSYNMCVRQSSGRVYLSMSAREILAFGICHVYVGFLSHIPLFIWYLSHYQSFIFAFCPAFNGDLSLSCLPFVTFSSFIYLFFNQLQQSIYNIFVYFYLKGKIFLSHL